VPRALALRYVAVAGDARADYLARLAERAASARAAAFHLWAFEDDARPGRFVEFVETRDAAALATALLHDELLGESLDFRHAPPGGVSGAPAPAWERFTGVADS
jgi:hypothetical protein